MLRYLTYIFALIFTTCCVSGCSKQEVLESYEEMKAIEQVPLSFSPYVGSTIESDATTRADLNYLTNLGFASNFDALPYLGYSKGNYRYGRTAYNSYIVGIFGYYHGDGETNKWDDVVTSEKKANFMTNQPLRQTSNNVWEYSPLKYWPNSSGANVTFISYYPFQDYEYMDDGTTPGEYYRAGRDKQYANENAPNGTKYNEADLTCITPPQPGTTGEAAYTFTFKQKNKVEEHVDFMLGITPNITKQKVGSGISLNLRHSLCAVRFDLRFDKKLEGYSNGASYPDEVRFDIKSIGFEGLYTSGKVYPKIVKVNNKDQIQFNWSSLGDPSQWTTNEEAETTDTYRLYFNIENEKPYGVYKKTNYNAAATSYAFARKSGTNAIYDNNQFMKYLMLVVPQKAQLEEDGVTPRTSYLVVKYDMTYTNGDQKVVYKDCLEKIKLDDNEKDASQGLGKGQLFNAGAVLTFNIGFKIHGISMDVSETDWEAEDERQVPIEDKQTGDNGGE